ncbi:MAG: hypothetical protein V7L23_16160 [Nostoc sp.]|uniref:hypothetical protein n=1 Tax=Nostoc sp. TaxID=1180 RepID=UPI002FEF2E51
MRGLTHQELTNSVLEIAATQTFVRLRGLKEFETHGGGFCLYSREFHSPGQGVFLQIRLTQ